MTLNIRMSPGGLCSFIMMSGIYCNSCDNYQLFIEALFLPFWTRYYNCVPFAGCVFVAPSKLYQPRVKTFDELPLEVHPQKVPQVSSFPLSSSNTEPAADIWKISLLRKLITETDAAFRDGQWSSQRPVSLCRTTRQTAGWFWPLRN